MEKANHQGINALPGVFFLLRQRKEEEDTHFNECYQFFAVVLAVITGSQFGLVVAVCFGEEKYFLSDLTNRNFPRCGRKCNSKVGR